MEFFFGDWPFVVQDTLGNKNLPDIMNATGESEFAQFVCRDSECPAKHFAVSTDRFAMSRSIDFS